MKHGCLSYIQCKYSRYVFMKYLYSKEFTDTFGVALSNNISTSIRQYVITHENYFLYCNWNTIRHYVEYSNTPLEGTNFEIKHLALSTHPGLSMDSIHICVTEWSLYLCCRYYECIFTSTKFRKALYNTWTGVWDWEHWKSCHCSSGIVWRESCWGKLPKSFTGLYGEPWISIMPCRSWFVDESLSEVQ